MAPYSNIRAWKIPWPEESDGLQSMGSQRIEVKWLIASPNNPLSDGQEIEGKLKLKKLKTEIKKESSLEEEEEVICFPIHKSLS